VEEVKFILESRSCPTSDDVHSLDEEDIYYQLSINHGGTVGQFGRTAEENTHKYRGPKILIDGAMGMETRMFGYLLEFIPV